MFDEMSPFVFGLYKVIKMVVWPLTWIWALVAVAVVLLLGRPTAARLKVARIATISAFILLYGLSAGPVSAYLAGLLEQRYPPFRMVPGQAFDAIVVLTGDLMPKRGARPVTELTHTTLQRTMCGADAYAQGLSIKLLLSGGSLEPGGMVDAIEMKKLAMRIGVPEQAIVLEDRSRNTYESAKEAKRVLGERATVLLVTSAIHIPRAIGLFRKQGLEVTPYPCGYLTHQEIRRLPEIGVSSFLPDVASLSRGTAALNELFGLAVYRLAGKL
jgi:uncharacterized SAM-binding protein YcdF (DUF218 family)